MATAGSKPIEQHIAHVLERIGEVARSDQWKELATSELNPLQARIMGFVVDHVAEPVGVARLALELQLSKPTISDCVKTLVTRKLLKRTTDPNDKRGHSLHVTAQGRKALGAGAPENALQRSVAAMGSAEKEALLLGLMNVLHKLFQDGAVQVQRMCWTCEHYRGDRISKHRCALLDLVLKPKDLRMDCPEHVLEASGNSA